MRISDWSSDVCSSDLRLQPQHVSRSFGVRYRRAGLSPICLHDLRHTSATLALTAGIHPKVVSERLGHSTVQLTLDRSSPVVAGIHASAAEPLGATIFTGRGSTATAQDGYPQLKRTSLARFHGLLLPIIA